MGAVEGWVAESEAGRKEDAVLAWEQVGGVEGGKASDVRAEAAVEEMGRKVGGRARALTGRCSN